MRKSDQEPVGLLERLRNKGWRLTAQRRAVAEALSGANLHLTADEIFARASSRLPEVSKATVYNTLHELIDMGEVLEIRFMAGPTRYDPNARQPHQHLACENCGHLYDVHPKGIEGLSLPPSERHDFTITDVDVVFKGFCNNCQKSKKTIFSGSPR